MIRFLLIPIVLVAIVCGFIAGALRALFTLPLLIAWIAVTMAARWLSIVAPDTSRRLLALSEKIKPTEV